jgi:hypothetical protein
VSASRPNWSYPVALLILFAAVAANARSSRHTVRMRVHFLATSTSVHSVGSVSEDVYLVELSLAHAADASTVYARLVYRYPEYRAPLPVRLLTAQAGTVFRLIRDESCDRPLGNMPLRTGPGDPRAILSEPLRYRVSLPSTDPSTELPCYRVVSR